MKMYRRHADEFDFFPQTYVLPVEYNEFRSQLEKPFRGLGKRNENSDSKNASDSKPASNDTYIIKPENLCQGRGIYLVKDPNDVDPSENCVA